VRDRRDPAHRPRRDPGIAQIALDPLGGGIEVRRALAVRGGQERVDGPDRVTGGQQRVDDVRADESGASGDEDRGGHGARSLRGCNPLVASAA
jgi:hypothetical protein